MSDEVREVTGTLVGVEPSGGVVLVTVRDDGGSTHSAAGDHNATLGALAGSGLVAGDRVTLGILSWGGLAYLAEPED